MHLLESMFLTESIYFFDFILLVKENINLRRWRWNGRKNKSLIGWRQRKGRP